MNLEIDSPLLILKLEHDNKKRFNYFALTNSLVYFKFSNTVNLKNWVHYERELKFKHQKFKTIQENAFLLCILDIIENQLREIPSINRKPVQRSAQTTKEQK